MGGFSVRSGSSDIFQAARDLKNNRNPLQNASTVLKAQAAVLQDGQIESEELAALGGLNDVARKTGVTTPGQTPDGLRADLIALRERQLLVQSGTPITEGEFLANNQLLSGIKNEAFGQVQVLDQLIAAPGLKPEQKEVLVLQRQVLQSKIQLTERLSSGLMNLAQAKLLGGLGNQLAEAGKQLEAQGVSLLEQGGRGLPSAEASLGAVRQNSAALAQTLESLVVPPQVQPLKPGELGPPASVQDPRSEALSLLAQALKNDDPVQAAGLLDLARSRLRELDPNLQQNLGQVFDQAQTLVGQKNKLSQQISGLKQAQSQSQQALQLAQPQDLPAAAELLRFKQGGPAGPAVAQAQQQEQALQTQIQTLKNQLESAPDSEKALLQAQLKIFEEALASSPLQQPVAALLPPLQGLNRLPLPQQLQEIQKLGLDPVGDLALRKEILTAKGFDPMLVTALLDPNLPPEFVAGLTTLDAAGVKNLNDQPSQLVPLLPKDKLPPDKVLMQPPQVQTIGAKTANFLDVLNPLDSPGDAIEIRLEGEAGLKIWGPLGVEANAQAGIKVSMGDDGLYYVSFDVQADVGLAVGNKNAKGKIAGGGAKALTFRFENKEQINQFLLQKFNQQLPAELRKQFFPALENNTQSIQVRPISQVSVYGKLQGQAKIGKVEASVALEARSTTSTYETGPNRPPVVSNDFSRSAQLNISLNDTVKLSAKYTYFKIEKDPLVSENEGTYHRAEGTLTFSLSSAQGDALKKLKSKGNLTAEERKLANAIVLQFANVADKLGLTGPLSDKFVKSLLEKAVANVEQAEGAGGGKSISFGIAFQAQWEAGSDDGSGELQYFRLGTAVISEKSIALDLGVASAEVKSSSSATDVTDVVVGDKDETYLAGLYFNNPKQYALAKTKLGGDDALVGTDKNRKPLREWEQEWQNKGPTRVGQFVEAQVSEFGAAQALTDFALQNFKALDADNNGYLTRSELEGAKSRPEFAAPAAQALLNKLLSQFDSLQKMSNDEYGRETSGITRADLSAFLENTKNQGAAGP